MLVKCDKCGQSYEVDDSRIPAKGARMKCPACKSVLFVNSNGTTKSVDAAPTADFGNSDKGTPQGGVTPPKAGIPQSETAWKVRHVGMTYTFHDLDGLQNWLSVRSSLENVKIAKNDDNWRELGDYKEVLTTDIIAKFFPLGDVPTSQAQTPGVVPSNAVDPAPALPNLSNAPVVMSNIAHSADDMASYKRSRKAQQKRQKESLNEKKKTKRLITTGIFAVVLVLAGIFAWRYFSSTQSANDVVLTEHAAPTPLEPAKTPESKKPTPAKAPVAPPPAADQETTAGIDVDDVEAEAEFELQKQIYEAEELVSKKMWPEARAMLESLRKDMPEQIDVLRLLSQTYKGLGLNDMASKLDAQIDELKQKQNVK